MIKIITSASNKIVQDAIKLKDKKYRRLTKLFLVEGVRIVNEVPGELLLTLFVNEKNISKLKDIIDKTDANKVICLSENVFDKISDTVNSQGLIAVVRMAECKSIQELARRHGGNMLLLDGISNADNMGTILRTASACEYNVVLLVNCTDPFSPKAVRGSMGAVFRLDIINTSYEQIEGLCNCNAKTELQKGKVKNVQGQECIDANLTKTLIAATLDGVNVFDVIYGEKVVNPEYYVRHNILKKHLSGHILAIGSEAEGLSQQILNLSSLKVTLPMANNTESLNASVSAGILMYLFSQAKPNSLCSC